MSASSSPPRARALTDYLPRHRLTVRVACAWKRAYPTRPDAVAAIREVRRAAGGRPPAPVQAHLRALRAYPCPFLHPGAWHIGEPPSPAAMARLAAAIRNLPPPRRPC